MQFYSSQQKRLSWNYKYAKSTYIRMLFIFFISAFYFELNPLKYTFIYFIFNSLDSQIMLLSPSTNYKVES